MVGKTMSNPLPPAALMVDWASLFDPNVVSSSLMPVSASKASAMLGWM